MLAKQVGPVRRAAARSVVTCLIMVLGFGLGIPLVVAAAALLVTIGVPNGLGAAAAFCSIMAATVAAGVTLARRVSATARDLKPIPVGVLAVVCVVLGDFTVSGLAPGHYGVGQVLGLLVAGVMTTHLAPFHVRASQARSGQR